MAQRVTYRRQCSYNTRSNKIRKVKTPGGRVIAQHTSKRNTLRRCVEPGCEVVLGGLSNARSIALRNLSYRKRTVSRPYGGNLCGACVRERIVRAFLTEEVKIAKKVKQTKRN
ncbi:hypothetical protein PPERSA_05863 [Pseudocohnilembus persalinus]|uniref:Ribosomal protein L34Ae n=1 Tax=Pseudocohnilembus persalinus TaxID=266149 RepID=A0A0V0R477_PSEPJ|nr:hypothetical protein PPERSA_05863 [Pseudocohnilembus persalinus]|eukprot:KRX09194.1 hypothetical protein PPERSA_05863 [Pseudocohnilembus persalinus]